MTVHNLSMLYILFFGGPLCSAVMAAVIQSVEDFSHGSTCIIDGSVYKSGEKIPREHACHVCICVRGRAECAWQDCPLPPDGCTALEFPELCNPALYLCSIPNNLDGRNKESRVVPRAADVLPDDLEGTSRNRADCNILGVPYKTGDVVGAASHHCLECRCGRQDLYCSPRCCFRPSSLLETPSQIMRALIIGPKLPQKHPLHYLQLENL